MVERILSITSIVITFIVTIISSYLFSQGRINFETLVLIIMGATVIMIIMIYQEINNKLDQQKWEQKRLDEKLKIYERLAKIETEVGI